MTAFRVGIMKKGFLLLWFAAGTALAAVSVQDDAGRTITLPGPARRIVSMAPHITEFLFASGGEKRIVGVTSYSDYPPCAHHPAGR